MRLRDPCMGATQHFGYEGQLERIHTIGLEKLPCQLGTTQQYQSLNSCSIKGSETFHPGHSQGDPALEAVRWRLRRHKPTLQRLFKKGPVEREIAASTHHH